MIAVSFPDAFLAAKPSDTCSLAFKKVLDGFVKNGAFQH